MKPVDYRNETWRDVLRRVSGHRAQVYAALLQHGPCTTRDLAKRMDWDLLNVRPRVTELCQIGLARSVGGRRGNGVYEAVRTFEAQHKFDAQKVEAQNDQIMLKF